MSLKRPAAEGCGLNVQCFPSVFVFQYWFLGVKFGKVVTPVRSRLLLEGTAHWRWALNLCSSVLLPVLCLLTVKKLREVLILIPHSAQHPVPMEQCFPYSE